MRVLILGATGMAGHVVALYFHESGHDVTTLTRTPFEFCTTNHVGDVTDFSLVKGLVEDGHFDAIINCVGILNQEAERNKALAVLLNSYLPHLLSDLTKQSGTKVIHVSTDCVFSGSGGPYTETSFRDGNAFYDRSKALGELENDKDLTIRTSIVGPDRKKDGIGLFNWFMKQQGEVNGFKKVMWTGVTTLTLAKAIEQAIRSDLTGLYNLVNNQAISKYELLTLFNEYMRGNTVLVKETHTPCSNRTLLNGRTDFRFDVPSYRQMVSEMKTWMDQHKELYPHYYG